MAHARIALGSRRRRSAYEAWVRRALGIQCNGYPAYDRFAELSPSALLFFDTRLTAEHVRSGPQRRAPADSRPPYRLCFSGRLIEAKGPQHAVAAADLLRAQGIECTLDVIGVGPLEQQLRRPAEPRSGSAKAWTSREGWTSYVRDEVDLMVLPHTQGDPSGTYLESAGCGVPVVGFDNVALDGARPPATASASTVPLGDDEALGRRLRETSSTTPGAERSCATTDCDFMEAHTFEREADRRVDAPSRACAS